MVMIPKVKLKVKTKMPTVFLRKETLSAKPVASNNTKKIGQN
jgi:hypothetical protein